VNKMCNTDLDHLVTYYNVYPRLHTCSQEFA